MKQMISLCMIVRNEERFLPQCLESVRGAVDEIVIVDTGSEDSTTEIALKFHAKVFEHPWRNSFSEARNFSLDKASGDWILILDADEELEKQDIPLFQKYILQPGIDALSFINISFMPDGGVCRHRNIRLFRRDKVHYEGIVHNFPIVEGREKITPIRIYHHGYNLSSEELKRKYKRSEKLLLKQVHEEPGNLHAKANLIRNYRLQKLFGSMIDEAEETLKLTDSFPFVRQMIVNDLVYGYFTTGKYDRAEYLGIQALKDNPNHLDLLFILGSVMVKQKKLKEAIDYYQCYLTTLKSGKEMTGMEGLLIDTYGYEGNAWNNIGSCYVELGQIENAIESYKKAVECNGNNVIWYKNLAGLYLQSGRLKSASDVLEKAIDLDLADDTIIRSLEKLKMIDLQTTSSVSGSRSKPGRPDILF